MVKPLVKGQVVYRMERSTGQGPYSNYNGDNWKDPAHYQRDSVVSPLVDDTEKWRERLENKFGYWGVKFGFTSLQQLQGWFSDSEMNRLKALGFLIKEYQVLEGYFSNHQCVFSPLKKEG